MPARRPESSPQTRAVLLALGDRAGWSYGYDLTRTTGLKSGTLYPMLARLAELGLLESSWEPEPPEGRPRRHLYRLTAAGAELARSLPAERAARSRRGWTAPGSARA